MKILAERKLGESVIDWRESFARPSLSRDDMIVLLGRGTPRRTRTLFSEMRRIPPGHQLLSDIDGKCRLERTWSALQHSPPQGVDDFISALRTLIPEAVADLGSIGKVGVLLSGGFDSTLITALLARMGIETQCYVIEPPGRGGFKEWQYAARVANMFRFPIRRVAVTLEDLLQTSRNLLRIRCRPQVCWVVANQFVAARAAKEDKCDVLMLGTGSDEIFGPYPRMAHSALRFERLSRAIGSENAWNQVLGERSRSRSQLLFLGLASPFRRQHLHKLFPDTDITSLLETDVVELFRELHHASPSSGFSSLIMQLELELRSSDVILDELNAASSLAGMPTVYPFYQKAVVELAAQIPIELKSVCGNVERLKYRPKKDMVDKYILRLAFEDVVPDFVHIRPRSSYTLPFGWWMRGDKREALSNSILDSPVWREIGASKSAITEFASASLSGYAWRAPFRFWMLYQVAQWWRDCEAGRNFGANVCVAD